MFQKTESPVAWNKPDIRAPRVEVSGPWSIKMSLGDPSACLSLVHPFLGAARAHLNHDAPRVNLLFWPRTFLNLLFPSSSLLFKVLQEDSLQKRENSALTCKQMIKFFAISVVVEWWTTWKDGFVLRLWSFLVANEKVSAFRLSPPYESLCGSLWLCCTEASS